MKIGNIQITTPIILAPMAGVTDRSFRIICKEFGAGMVFTEFVSSNGIIHENEKTLNMIKFSDAERPIGVQIFGNDPIIVGKSAKMVCNMFNPDIIDINFGCPVPKVVKKGAGSGALRDLKLMQNITSEVIKNAGNTPVTVKMRAGWDNNTIVSTEAGIMLEKLGIKAITLHPRTTSQSFTGNADWSLIRDLKKNVSIPVIGNGDIITVDDAKNMFESTGCDAVMVARGVLGNPWLIQSIKNYLINQPDNFVGIKEKLEMCKKHFKLLLDDKSEQLCINYTKKHFSWYLKGFTGASELRKKFMGTKSTDEIKLLLDWALKNYNENIKKSATIVS